MVICTGDYTVRGKAEFRTSDVSAQSSGTLLIQERNLCFLNRQQQMDSMDSANLAELASPVNSGVE
jgi:hypothetical protein